MDSRANPSSAPVSFSGPSAAYFRPVLARAAELGRGPAGLVGLLRVRGTGDSALAQLAGELNRAVREAGVDETRIEFGRRD
jgi:hypothetical protein